MSKALVSFAVSRGLLAPMLCLAMAAMSTGAVAAAASTPVTAPTPLSDAVSLDAVKALSGGVDSSVQATVRPLKLAIADDVELAGSDAASLAFQKEVLPSLVTYMKKLLPESKKFNDSSMLLDPKKLKLATESMVRAYFVGEGASYKNTLGINSTGTGVKSGNPELIFPDASTTAPLFTTGAGLKRTALEPLLPGDFVNLGKYPAGTMLDFFLIAYGASGGKDVWNTTTAANSDGINHVISFVSTVANSSYLIIAFEDVKGGGDHDYNDLVIAIDIRTITSAPEPALGAVLGTFLTGALALRRRRVGVV